VWDENDVIPKLKRLAAAYADVADERVGDEAVEEFPEAANHVFPRSEPGSSRSQ
jgi:hypothetical protein